MRLTLHLTRRCNLRCDYCYADCLVGSEAVAKKHAGERTDMSLETAMRAVDFGFEQSASAAHFGFFGGEPTLRLDLMEAVARAATERSQRDKRPVTFEVTTNGTRVTSRFLDLVDRYQMIVAVSIDGAPDVHNTHRKLACGSGAFEALDRSIDRLLDRIPWVIAYSVVTPATVGRLASSTEYLIDRGFQILVVWPDQSAHWTTGDLAVLRRQFRRLQRLYLRWTREKKKFFLSSFDGAIQSYIKAKSSDCGAGQDHLSIGPSGKIYPCVQFVGDESDSRWVLGSVEDGLDEARLQQHFPHLVGRSPECSGCELSARCASGCPCANLTATGRPDRVSPIQCATQRLVIPLADRAAAQLYQAKDPLFIHKHYNQLYPVAHCLERVLGEGDQP